MIEEGLGLYTGCYLGRTRRCSLTGLVWRRSLQLFKIEFSVIFFGLWFDLTTIPMLGNTELSTYTPCLDQLLVLYHHLKFKFTFFFPKFFFRIFKILSLKPGPLLQLIKIKSPLQRLLGCFFQQVNFSPNFYNCFEKSEICSEIDFF